MTYYGHPPLSEVKTYNIVPQQNICTELFADKVN